MAEPVRIGEVLAGLPGLADHLAVVRLLAAWPAIAGPGAARSRADALDDGVLQVAVGSAGWLHRLRLEEPALLARCRALAPAVTVRAIRFRLESLADPGADGREAR
jgi:predicted nucleic acid-binding Zn ribbon protein